MVGIVIKKRIVNGDYCFKFLPRFYGIKDIEYWIINSTTPDIIYVKSKDLKRLNSIEVNFEVMGKNGNFIIKKIFFDGVEMGSDSIISNIKKKCYLLNDCLELIVITEYNNPIYFQKILENLKSKK